MKRVFLLVALVTLTACGNSHYQYSVYGRTGAKYQAPALCEALTKCLNGNETECYYENWQTSAGEVVGCSAVKK